MARPLAGDPVAQQDHLEPRARLVFQQLDRRSQVEVPPTHAEVDVETQVQQALDPLAQGIRETGTGKSGAAGNGRGRGGGGAPQAGRQAVGLGRRTKGVRQSLGKGLDSLKGGELPVVWHDFVSLRVLHLPGRTENTSADRSQEKNLQDGCQRGKDLPLPYRFVNVPQRNAPRASPANQRSQGSRGTSTWRRTAPIRSAAAITDQVRRWAERSRCFRARRVSGARAVWTAISPRSAWVRKSSIRPGRAVRRRNWASPSVSQVRQSRSSSLASRSAKGRVSAQGSNSGSSVVARPARRPTAREVKRRSTWTWKGAS